MVAAVAILGTVMINMQTVSAPRQCAGCLEFKKLTHEFEKAVIDAASVGDPNIIPGLLEQYNQAVQRLFTGPE
jgi:hypothetical protein